MVFIVPGPESQFVRWMAYKYDKNNSSEQTWTD